VVLISGGVSVGRHDHVKNVLSDLGVKPIFWRVKVKPGKPLFFGRLGAANGYSAFLAILCLS